MTQAELWQLVLMAASNSVTSTGLVLTIISAYLVAAYFVGHRFSRYQAAVVSILFVLGSGLASIMAFVNIWRSLYFLEQLASQFGVQTITPKAAIVYASGALLLLLIPASLFFMYQIRRDPALGAGEGQAGSSPGRRYFD